MNTFSENFNINIALNTVHLCATHKCTALPNN